MPKSDIGSLCTHPFNNIIIIHIFLLDLKLYDKESRSTQLVFSYQGGKKVSNEINMHQCLFSLPTTRRSAGIKGLARN